jgi:hypothetical protein
MAGESPTRSKPVAAVRGARRDGGGRAASSPTRTAPSICLPRSSVDLVLHRQLADARALVVRAVLGVEVDHLDAVRKDPHLQVDAGDEGVVDHHLVARVAPEPHHALPGRKGDLLGVGLASVASTGRRAGALTCAATGLLTCGLHAVFLHRDRVAFWSPGSLAILMCILATSVTQGAVALWPRPAASR